MSEYEPGVLKKYGNEIRKEKVEGLHYDLEKISYYLTEVARLVAKLEGQVKDAQTISKFLKG